jgi:inner membrane transporter RhtA
MERSQAYPVALVLAGTVSVQIGGAVAFNLFDELGPAGTVFLRVGFAALVVGMLWHPTVRGKSREALKIAVLFGFALAAMNQSFYAGLERVPLGLAVTFEFVGPLGVAIVGSRRPRDLLWVALAAGGILLLAPDLGGSLDLLGVSFCLLAGCFWAAYIVLSQRVGQEFAGAHGLALALVVGTVLLLPGGIAQGGSDLLQPELLATGFALAILSSAIPYSVELEALRYLRTGTFGVLMSLEPAVAALVGFVALDQGLEATEILAIAMVVTASAGALRTAAGLPPETPEREQPVSDRPSGTVRARRTR